MTRIRTLLAAASCATALISLAPRARAVDPASATYILPMCYDYIGHVDVADAGYCLGVVHGVWDMALSYGDVCSPDGTTADEVVRKVVAIIERERTRQDQPFAGLALGAMNRLWPCHEAAVRPRLNS